MCCAQICVMHILSLAQGVTFFHGVKAQQTERVMNGWGILLARVPGTWERKDEISDLYFPVIFILHQNKLFLM